MEVLFVLSFAVFYVSGESFNLFGDAGQAYAIEVYLGHPPQKMNLIVDTGSTTLAVASYARENSDIYFSIRNSTTVIDIGKEVQAKYSQGNWLGQLVSDFVQFPSLLVPEVRSNIAAIKKSHKFFMNGSGWQGLLGLAYLPVGAWGDNVVVESWIDSVERQLRRQFSFSLQLCGVQSTANATHYGKFKMVEDGINYDSYIYRTPILIKRWYEIGVVAVRVSLNDRLQNSSESNMTTLNSTNFSLEDEEETCKTLNKEKSILDSGTTNIRLPDALFRKVVDELRNTVQKSNVILDEFWYGEAACWPQPQEWSLPSLSVDLLSYEFDNQYFTLELPAQNYMRLVSAHNNSSENASESAFCYKLGLEAGGKETVLGYTAMEGFEVLFNRTAGWIGFRTSTCGPETRIHGPYYTSDSITRICQLKRLIPEVAVSIKAAQWALCALSIIASTVLVYLLAPCIKNIFFRRIRSPVQMSLSQTALVDNVE